MICYQGGRLLHIKNERIKEARLSMEKIKINKSEVSCHQMRVSAL
jgi:hypothetical protein